MNDGKLQKLLSIAVLGSVLALPGVASAGRGSSLLEPVRISGSMGVRPFLGGYADLQLDVLRNSLEPSVAGDKFVFGADLVFGEPYGLAYVVGLHLGAGDGNIVLQPVAEVHYRWDIGMPIVPWVGGGFSVKLGLFNQPANFAITGRFVFGVEYFINSTLSIGTQFAAPDIGARLFGGFGGGQPVGTVEWIIGPHLRL